MTNAQNMTTQTPVRPMLNFKMLDVLQPGDSVLLAMCYYGSLGPCLGWRKRRYGKTFMRRVEGNGVRIWRLT
jgi:hypothetical protein